jgi:polysaccharide biosynthesis transport protein
MNTPLPPQNAPWVDRVNLFFKYRRYIKMLARRWHLLFLAAVLGTGSMAYKAYQTPNIYQASSKIGVAPKISKPHAAGVQLVEELNYFYDNQLSLMSSRDVLVQVEQRLKEKGVGPSPARLEPVVGRDKGNLTMLVRSTDFEYARNYATEWARAFLDYKSEQREKLIGKSAKTTREEVIKYEKRLAKAREEMTKFQRDHNIASVKEMGEALQRQHDERYKEFQDLVTLRQRLENKSKEDLADGGIGEQKVVTVRESEKTIGPGFETRDPLEKYLAGSGYSKLKFESKQKELDRDRLNATLKPGHPFMVKLNEEISRLQDNIRYELEEIENKRVARIRSLKIDETALKPVLDDLQKRLFEARQVQTDFGKLQEEEGQAKEVLERLNRQLQEIELTPTDESQFNILEEGIGSAKPVEPNRVKMVMTGLLAGMLIGLGLVYFLDRLDDRLELAEEVEAALQEPVLGQVPKVPRMDGGPVLVSKLDEHNMFSEALRGVRSAVLLGFGAQRKKVLLVTSAVPSDGKTTFTTNFAITLAIAGHKVLLIDADLRRGASHTFFGNSRETGFSDVLQGELHWTDVMRQTDIETLKVIHTGKLPQNPGELLISPIPEQLIEEAREEFDFVIFDCPPLTAIDDTFSLISFSDGVLFVVRSGQTSMRFAKNSLHAIRQRGAQVLGLVLNGITPDNPHYYYQSYYHSYYTSEAKEAGATDAVPVKKMAAPKKGRVRSIQEMAKSYDESGDVFEDAASKAAQFKARRLARQVAKSSERD